MNKPEYLGTVRYAYTNHKAAADYYRAVIDETKFNEPFEWKEPNNLPLPAHHRKAISLFLHKTIAEVDLTPFSA